MSVIGAKTFFFFEGDSQPDTHIICRPDYFQQDGFRLPASGVTLLYGHKGPGSLIGAAVRQSASSGAGVVELGHRPRVPAGVIRAQTKRAAFGKKEKFKLKA